MNTKKILGYVVWLVTFILPFKMAYTPGTGSDSTRLIAFLITMVGVGVGGFLVSASTTK